MIEATHGIHINTHTQAPSPQICKQFKTNILTPTYVETPSHNLSAYIPLTSNSLNFVTAELTAIKYFLFLLLLNVYFAAKMSMQFDFTFWRGENARNIKMWLI